MPNITFEQLFDEFNENVISFNDLHFVCEVYNKLLSTTS